MYSGALETLVKLREEGTVKYLGFSSHNSPPASAEAMKRFDFDVVLLAANASKVPFIGEFEPLGDSSFEEMCLPMAIEKGIEQRPQPLYNFICSLSRPLA